MLAGMHFMDSYNYDVERVKRCVIHYAAPNGKIYPFCAYNSGPVYRERVEREFAVPLEQAAEMKRLELVNRKSPLSYSKENGSQVTKCHLTN